MHNTYLLVQVVLYSLVFHLDHVQIYHQAHGLLFVLRIHFDVRENGRNSSALYALCVFYSNLMDQASIYKITYGINYYAGKYF